MIRSDVADPALVLFPSASSRMFRCHLEYGMMFIRTTVKEFVECQSSNPPPKPNQEREEKYVEYGAVLKHQRISLKNKSGGIVTTSGHDKRPSLTIAPPGTAGEHPRLSHANGACLHGSIFTTFSVLGET